MKSKTNKSKSVNSAKTRNYYNVSYSITE